jgi:predicted extracellular nuclease
MEMENDAAPNSAVADLDRGQNDAMGAGTYSYIDTGVIGADAIKVALIYKPAKAMPVGDWKIITSAVDPRFDETKNRPSLAQTFLDLTTGEKLTVVVNHLKSKGSDCLPDDPDTGDGSGNCNLTRTRAAAALVDWLKTDPTGSGDSDFLLIGDMNSYTFESPITTFENGGFTNLVRKFGGLAAYSYVFDGESGYLDHALATGSLVGQVTGVAHWHINPDEPTALDYNVNFKTQNQVSTFYAPTPYRSSDHDPVVIGVDFEPTAAGVCTLTQLYVTKPVLVNSLCVKLREGSFGAFENEINAQAGKALTAERAALLARLARTLAGS